MTISEQELREVVSGPDPTLAWDVVLQDLSWDGSGIRASLRTTGPSDGPESVIASFDDGLRPTGRSTPVEGEVALG